MLFPGCLVSGLWSNPLGTCLASRNSLLRACAAPVLHWRVLVFLQSFSRCTIGPGSPPYYGHGAPSTGQPSIAAAFANSCEPGRVGHLLVVVRTNYAPHFRDRPWRQWSKSVCQRQGVHAVHGGKAHGLVHWDSTDSTVRTEYKSLIHRDSMDLLGFTGIPEIQYPEPRRAQCKDCRGILRN